MDQNYPPLTELLPHKEPMILLSEVHSISNTSACSKVRISPESPFFEIDQGVPLFVGVEYMAQTIGLVDGWRNKRCNSVAQLGFLISVSRYTSNNRYFEPGSILYVFVNHIWGDEQLMQFEGHIKLNSSEGHCLAQGTLNVYRNIDDNKTLEVTN